MPNFDKTGPAGEGPVTGRGQGNCFNKGQKLNFVQNGLGRRRCCAGMMRGGMGISLDDQEKILENRLEAIRKVKK